MQLADHVATISGPVQELRVIFMTLGAAIRPLGPGQKPAKAAFDPDLRLAHHGSAFADLLWSCL
jgi:hypothetical protein